VFYLIIPLFHINLNFFKKSINKTMNQKILIDNLLKLFRGETTTLRLNEIAKGLQISSDSPDYEILKSILHELCTQGILSKSSRRRYGLNITEDVSTNEGIIHIKGGQGFVVMNNDSSLKVRIKRRYLNTALDGDTVIIRFLPAKKNRKPRGEVIKILERNDIEIPGKIEFYDNIHFFIPDDEKYYVDFIINEKKLNGAKDGDKVKIKLLHWDNPMKSPQGEVVKIVSSPTTIGEVAAEFDSIIDEFNLPPEFPDKVLKLAQSIKNPNLKTILKERLDLRDETIITIDPIDAKDFDDALSLKFLDNGNRLLGVHIADVSYFVTEKTELDMEALKRGNSVYLVDRVIPMLPEELSNDVCSLKPKRIRLTYSVLMEISPNGVVVDYQIAESIIKSSRRFAYEEVQQIIEAGKGELEELILPLHQLSVQLRENRFALGGVDFESIEVKFELDENKNPIKAEPRKSTPATKLVEECMLLANKTVAMHVRKISKKYKLPEVLPFLYRIHDEPNPEKLKENLTFLKSLGIKFNIRNNSSKEINRVVKLFEDKPEKYIVHQILLRSMAKAEYSSKNIGHYGLGFLDYAHFTSPIRRYPDLIVHRLLKEYNKAKPKPNKIDYYNTVLENIGQHCTDTEREAMEAERACSRLAQTFMARKFLGKELDGRISGITNFGIFVLMEDFWGEGLIHIRDLRDDYYYFDEQNHRLTGKRNKKSYKLGDKIKVRVIHVNIEARKIELELVRNK
jgi:ribonuclease R